MIDVIPHLTKDAIWRKVAGTNQYGEHTYSNETIKVRWEQSDAMVRSPQGVQGVSDTFLYTTSSVPVGDIVVDLREQEWTVIKVSEFAGLAGDTAYFQLWF